MKSKQRKLASERANKPLKRTNQLTNLYLAVKLSEEAEVVKKPANQPANQPTDQPTNEITYQPANHLANRGADIPNLPQ